MRAGRRGLAALCAVLALSGCFKAEEEAKVTAGTLDELSLARSLAVHDFRSATTIGGQEVVVEGLVEDDYRYRAAVRIDGRLAYEEVVTDDRRYLRVADPALLLPASALTPLMANRAVAPVLAGGWVVDLFGAPEEFTAGRTVAEVPLSPRLVLDRVRLLEALPETFKSGLREYNTDAIYYLPKDDKFPEHAEDGKRFDKLPKAYDTTASTITLDELRGYFEYLSVWAEEDGLTRLERLLELPDPADDRYDEVYRQIDRAGSGRLRALLAQGKEGRRITETYQAGPAAGESTVTEPTGATRVDLAAVVGVIRAVVAAAQTPSPIFGPLT